MDTQGHNSGLAAASTLALELDLSDSGFWRLTRQPGFPNPIRLGPRCTRFDRAAVMTWVKSHGSGTAKTIANASQKASQKAAA